MLYGPRGDGSQSQKTHTLSLQMLLPIAWWRQPTQKALRGQEFLFPSFSNRL